VLQFRAGSGLTHKLDLTGKGQSFRTFVNYDCKKYIFDLRSQCCTKLFTFLIYELS
jgi:hypothetical protein